MSTIDSFPSMSFSLRTTDGVFFCDGWRRNEFAVFEDSDQDWMVAHLPSGSVLPICFSQASAAVQFVTELYPLRNQWDDVDHDDFLRLLPAINVIGSKYRGRPWRTMFDRQPENPCDMNTYGDSHVG